MSEFVDMTTVEPYAQAERAGTPSRALTDPSSRTTRAPARQQHYKIFHYVLLVYLFLVSSRILELLPRLRVGLILAVILMIGLVVTRSLRAILRMPGGKLLIAFTCWLAVCVPFSLWRGGSLIVLRGTLQSVVLVVVMAAFIRTVKDAQRAMYTVGLAMGTIGLLSFVVGIGRGNEGSRLALVGGGATLADANFLALYLITGLPFMLLGASLYPGIRKWVSLLFVPPALIAIARTGSRMAMLALALGLLLYMFYASLKERALIAAGCVVFVVVALVFLPDKLRIRFATVFQSSENAASAGDPSGAQGVQQEAAASAELRERMLWRSLAVTAEHPLFGVGPGMFIDAEAATSKAEGKRAQYLYSHNTYTELSSETGLLGAGLFIATLWVSGRGLSAIRKRDPDRRIRRMALYTQLAIVMASACAFFLSVAYGGILYVLIGISGSFQTIVLRHVSAGEKRIHFSRN